MAFAALGDPDKAPLGIYLSCNTLKASGSGLNAFKEACRSLKRNQQHKVWQEGYHAEIAYSNRFIKQKMNYIHNNPVVDRIVAYPEDYLFCSA